jgi:hypothetical protein
VAVPVRESSPTAVHRIVADDSVVPVIVTVAIGAGRIPSGADSVAREITFEIPDQLGTSSPVLRAK